MVMLAEVAQTIELTKNHAAFIRRIIFRPQMSDRLAQMLLNAALARRYAPLIQKYPAADCKSAEIVGIAVATMFWSRAATNWLN
jgi:hypothetical protein